MPRPYRGQAAVPVETGAEAWISHNIPNRNKENPDAVSHMELS